MKRHIKRDALCYHGTMKRLDMNLLLTLDVLLSEGSVTQAAKRLNLSPSAMSRALTRLRETTGDPLLVRAGRGLVPTARALEIRDTVSALVQETTAVLSPTELPDFRTVERIFTIRTRSGFVESYGLRLMDRIHRDAPGICLRFVHKSNKGSDQLRDGSVDLETGVLGMMTGPEVRMQALFEDRFIGVVRQGHALTNGPVTADRFSQGRHILVARRSPDTSKPDEMLKAVRQGRDTAIIVEEFTTALALVRDSDLITTVPDRFTRHLRGDLFSFPLPYQIPGFPISLFWHPRMDADPVHRWVRSCVREVCLTPAPDSADGQIEPTV
jgi:DNA-binding transcriptional LysR family regulator